MLSSINRLLESSQDSCHFFQFEYYLKHFSRNQRVSNLIITVTSWLTLNYLWFIEEYYHYYYYYHHYRLLFYPWALWQWKDDRAQLRRRTVFHLTIIIIILWLIVSSTSLLPSNYRVVNITYPDWNSDIEKGSPPPTTRSYLQIASLDEMS